MIDITSLLRMAKERRASDLHLVVGSPPMARIDGALQVLDGHGDLTAEDIDYSLSQMATLDQQREFRHSTSSVSLNPTSSSTSAWQSPA